MTSSRRGRLPIERTEVEYLILADAVEAHDGKLYMMGGGWDRVYVRDLQHPVPIGMACGLSVPWSQTDDEHNLTLTIEDSDGGVIGPPLSLVFKTGRSAQLEKGAPTHVPFAVKTELEFPAHGIYVLRAKVDNPEDGHSRSLSFSVRPPTTGTLVQPA